MARKRISEYKAKTIVFRELGLPYQGVEIKNNDLSPIASLDLSKTYVVKVDQGVKKRFKLGLISLDVSKNSLAATVEALAQKGYTRFIIEPFNAHESSDETYISLQRSRDGIIVATSLKGGVDIEEQKGSINEYNLQKSSVKEVAKSIGVPEELIEKLAKVMDHYHFSFLEINPLVITDGKIFLLDLAVEVDSAGSFFVESAWNEDDFVAFGKSKIKEELLIDELSNQSQASFKLDILNRNGSIFMLLSGGGASIVLADEVYNQGKGSELANYGEYSGNPNSEETYHYTKQLLNVLLQSQAKKKVLIIAGGVANFTDIRVTFKGIIQSIAEVSDELRQEGVKVFVRRGGPFEKEGLAIMEAFLKKEGLYGFVSGPELVLTEIVTKALEELNHD